MKNEIERILDTAQRDLGQMKSADELAASMNVSEPDGDSREAKAEVLRTAKLALQALVVPQKDGSKKLTEPEWGDLSERFHAEDLQPLMQEMKTHLVEGLQRAEMDEDALPASKENIEAILSRAKNAVNLASIAKSLNLPGDSTDPERPEKEALEAAKLALQDLQQTGSQKLKEEEWRDLSERFDDLKLQDLMQEVKTRFVENRPRSRADDDIVRMSVNAWHLYEKLEGETVIVIQQRDGEYLNSLLSEEQLLLQNKRMKGFLEYLEAEKVGTVILTNEDRGEWGIEADVYDSLEEHYSRYVKASKLETEIDTARVQAAIQKAGMKGQIEKILEAAKEDFDEAKGLLETPEEYAQYKEANLGPYKQKLKELGKSNFPKLTNAEWEDLSTRFVDSEVGDLMQEASAHVELPSRKPMVEINHLDLRQRLEPGTVTVEPGLALSGQQLALQNGRLGGFLDYLEAQQEGTVISIAGRENKWQIEKEVHDSLETRYAQYVNIKGLKSEIDAGQAEALGVKPTTATKSGVLMNSPQIVERLGEGIGSIDQNLASSEGLGADQDQLLKERTRGFMKHLQEKGLAHPEVNGWRVAQGAYDKFKVLYDGYIDTRIKTVAEKITKLRKNPPEDLRSFFKTWPPEVLQKALDKYEREKSWIEGEGSTAFPIEKIQAKRALKIEACQRLEIIVKALEEGNFNMVTPDAGLSDKGFPKIQDFLREQNKKLLQIEVDYAYDYPSVLSAQREAHKQETDEKFKKKFPQYANSIQMGPAGSELYDQSTLRQWVAERYDVQHAERKSEDPPGKKETVTTYRAPNEKGQKVDQFEQVGNTLTAKTNDRDIARKLVEFAQMHGATSITVSGTAEFKEMVWAEAKARNIPVVGFTPTPEQERKHSEWVGRMQNAEASGEQKPTYQPTPAQERPTYQPTPSSGKDAPDNPGLTSTSEPGGMLHAAKPGPDAEQEYDVIPVDDGMAVPGGKIKKFDEGGIYIEPPKDKEPDPSEKPILYRVRPDQLPNDIKKSELKIGTTVESFTAKGTAEQLMHQADQMLKFYEDMETKPDLQEEHGKIKTAYIQGAKTTLEAIAKDHKKNSPEQEQAARILIEEIKDQASQILVDNLINEKSGNLVPPAKHKAASEGTELYNKDKPEHVGEVLFVDPTNGKAYVWIPPAPGASKRQAVVFSVSKTLQDKMGITLQEGTNTKDMKAGIKPGTEPVVPDRPLSRSASASPKH